MFLISSPLYNKVRLRGLIYNLFELMFSISIFDKNDRYFEEFIKIIYDPYKPLLAYCNKFHGGT